MSISHWMAGGYCPTQYHEPGASHSLLAGLATQSLLFLETERTLKMRTLPYLEVKAWV